MKKEVWYNQLSSQTINELKKIIDFEGLSHKKELRIFDFGCGNGRYMFAFKELFPYAKIIGADINIENIDGLKKYFPDVFVLDASKMDLNFPENYFDLIFSSNVLEHITYKLYLEYINAIHKVLKPGCRFVFGTPNYPYKRFYDMWKAAKALLKGNMKNFTYYLLDDPTHVNPLNYKKLYESFSLFKEVELVPTHIFMERFIKNKKFSDKINGIAIK